MSKDFINFEHIHFDALREVGNIGAGNAVTTLAKMLNKKVDMSVPVANMVDFKNIADYIGGAEKIVTGILIHLSGALNGMMMFIVENESAHALLKILMPGGTNDGKFSDMQLSALSEIGNILASSYLAALASLINKKIQPSIPYLAVDMANAILSVPAIEFGKIADQALFIESLFNADDERVSGYFILIPDEQSFKIILNSLGVE